MSDTSLTWHVPICCYHNCNCCNICFAATIVFLATQSSFMLGYSPDDVVVFPNVTYNEGSCDSNSTGKFTAPVSGLYAFTKQACEYHNKYSCTAFVHNNQEVLASVGYPNACSSAQIFVHMSRGDQMWVKTTASSFLYADSTRQTSFSGALMHTL